MPYSEFPELVFDFQIIIQVAKNEKRPSIPPECPELYRKLIVSCWAQVRDARPDIPTVLRELEAILNTYKDNKKAWDATAAPIDK